MSDRLASQLKGKPIVLGDGAMGTMLQEAGLTDGGAPEKWNLSRPDVVRAIYRGYIDAGSDFITTNSFGGTRFRLKLHQLEDQVFELNRAAASLAREVAGEAHLVAGSIGPTGELLVPLGSLTFEAARDAFAEQAAGLEAGGADFLLVETMSDLEEVRAAVVGARQATSLPLAVTMTFDTNYRTMMGVTPAQAVTTLHEWGVSIIGANCGNGPGEIERIMWEMSQASPEDVVLMAQSNAGLPHWDAGRISYDGTPQVMADYGQRMRALGVRVIGACCGSTPAHLRAMRAALDGPPLSGYEPPVEIAEAEAGVGPRKSARERRRQTRAKLAGGAHGS